MFHDVQAIRWEDAARMAAIVAGDHGALSAAISELVEAKLLLPPTSPGSGARAGFTIDPQHIFRANALDPSPFAERLGRMEERGQLSAGARRLAATLYYDDISRFPFRGSIGIHLITRREPLTPERGSLREFLARTSFHGSGKVVVLDDAHLMTEEAENALLKTLEEPPPRTLIVLVTSEPGRLLATIRSRAQEVRFARLASGDLAAALRGQGAGAEASDFIAAWADGSLGRALEGELEGLQDRRGLAADLAVALAEQDLARAMFVAFNLSGSDEEDTDRVRRHRRMTRNLELLLVWYRDLAVAAATGGAAELMNRDLAADIRRLAARRPAGFWEESFGIVSEALGALSPSSDYRLQAEALVAALALAARGRAEAVA